MPSTTQSDVCKGGYTLLHTLRSDESMLCDC